ncbi:hypothetical protein ACSBR1_005250 [Camellia fascicularis]
MERTEVVVNGIVEYVCSCCEASLKCLGVDYIDLYYVHWIDTSVLVEETKWRPEFRPSKVSYQTSSLQRPSLQSRFQKTVVVVRLRLRGVKTVT